jgi:hypothetical protein
MVIVPPWLIWPIWPIWPIWLIDLRSRDQR